MPAPDSDNSPATTRPIASIIFLVFCIAFAVGTIYFIKANIAAKREAILKNPGVATGIITRVRTYKGKRISVQYTVGGVEYKIRTRAPRNFLRTHGKGDTTAVIYSTVDPSNAILKAKFRSSAN